MGRSVVVRVFRNRFSVHLNGSGVVVRVVVRVRVRIRVRVRVSVRVHLNGAGVVVVGRLSRLVVGRLSC